MVVLYLVAAIVIPEADGSPGDVGEAVGSGKAAMVLGVLLAPGGDRGNPRRSGSHVSWDAVWPLILIGLRAAMVIATTRARR